MNTIKKAVGIFILSIIAISTIQWTCIQLISAYCAPWTWCGPITNIVSLGSPICQFLNHLQVGLADYYITIWAAAATSCLTYILSHTKS